MRYELSETTLRRTSVNTGRELLYRKKDASWASAFCKKVFGSKDWEVWGDRRGCNYWILEEKSADDKPQCIKIIKKAKSTVERDAHNKILAIRGKDKDWIFYARREPEE